MKKSIWRRIIERNFYAPVWNIGFRVLDESNAEVLPCGENRVKYKTIKIGESMHFADPFLFENDGKIYLFAESLNRYRNRGTLAVSEYKDGEFGKFKEIIIEKFHQSYPNVFKHGDDIYIICESSAVSQIRLYKAVDFPYKWKFDKVLLQNGNKYVDTSIISQDEKGLALITTYGGEYGDEVTEFYRLDMESKTLTLMDKQDVHGGRMAGNLFKFGNGYIRPVQASDGCYGTGVSLYKCNVENQRISNEECIGKMTLDNLVFDEEFYELSGTHTLNRGCGLEVVDIKYTRLCLSRRFIWLVNLLIFHRR